MYSIFLVWKIEILFWKNVYSKWLILFDILIKKMYVQIFTEIFTWKYNFF
jgi:hypothetical protein